MNGFEKLLLDWGLDTSSLMVMSSIVLLCVQKIKTDILWFTGYKTILLSLAFSFGISFMTYSNGETHWKTIIAATILCWLIPSGGKELLKNLSSGNNSRGITG